jgi:hypothetical protein
VGDVESVQRLTPVAVKITDKFRALTLVLDGYVQADETLSCPLCQMRFLLLLDPRDRQEHREASGDVRRAIAYLREKITQDHMNGHAQERFGMP